MSTYAEVLNIEERLEKVIKAALVEAGIEHVYTPRELAGLYDDDLPLEMVTVTVDLGDGLELGPIPSGGVEFIRYAAGCDISIVTRRTDDAPSISGMAKIRTVHAELLAKVRSAFRFGNSGSFLMADYTIKALKPQAITRAVDEARMDDITTQPYALELEINADAWPVS